MDDERLDDPGEWVDRHGDALYRYALLRLRDADRAAELVQEAFLHALQTRATFSGRSSRRTWLIGILKHKIIDQARAASRRRVLIDRLTDRARDRSEFTPAGRWRVGPAAWPVATGTAEFWEALHACLAQLPPALAETFLLRECDGLPAAEVQHRLGITPANLWARLHRARSHLRLCLETGPGVRTPAPQPAHHHEPRGTITP